MQGGELNPHIPLQDYNGGNNKQLNQLINQSISHQAMLPKTVVYCNHWLPDVLRLICNCYYCYYQTS